MGWWKLNCDTGGISEERPTGATGPLLNAFPGRDSVEDHYGGDEPADIMAHALAEIGRTYHKKWGRWPYLEELEGVFTFSMGVHRHAEAYQPQHYGMNDHEE